MKIVVINTAASNGGALSILKDFYNYIRLNDTQNEWIFILSDNYIESTENIRVIVKKEPKLNWLKRLKWEFIDGAKFINNLKADVVISMQNTMSINIKSKKLIYLHQPLPFQDEKKFSFFKRQELKMAIYQYVIGTFIKKSINNVDKVIVQTEWMKKSVLKKTSKLDSDVIVVSPNIDNMDLQVKDNYFEQNKFFYPASAAIYKNHKCIIDAVKILVKEGINNFVVELTIDEKNCKNLDITKEIQENIKFINHIKREEVFEKYRESVLIFPSYIETFGLPLLEAREIGSVIFASNCNFSKEILNDYKNKYYFNPFKSEELANLMKLILNNKIIRHEVDINRHEIKENSWSNVLEVIYSLGRM